MTTATDETERYNAAAVDFAAKLYELRRDRRGAADPDATARSAV